MEKEYAPSANEKKMNKKMEKIARKSGIEKTTSKNAENNKTATQKSDEETQGDMPAVENKEGSKENNPVSDNKETAEKKEKKIIKKEEAVAKAFSLPLSKKHCMYICSYIKGKPIDLAISELEEVAVLRRAIPFKGEIPHRKELGGKAGRYPVNASKGIIKMLKGLRGNIIANGMDLSKSRIIIASASWASRPAKRGGMRFKRANIVLKAKEAMEEKNENK